MDRSTVMVLAGALLLISLVLMVSGRGRPMTPERRARARRFLVLNGLWSTISAVWFTLVCIAAGIWAAINGDWFYVTIFSGCTVAMVLLGLLQRWWHRREVARLDAEGSASSESS